MEFKTQQVIDAINAAGITAVKIDAPIFELKVGTGTTPVTVYSAKGDSIEEGIEYIIGFKPLVVFVKDVFIEGDGTVIFRYATIAL